MVRRFLLLTEIPSFALVLGISLLLSAFISTASYAGRIDDEIRLNRKVIPVKNLSRNEEDIIYISLNYLCKRLGVRYRYDDLSELVIIKTGTKEIRMQVNNTMVFIDEEWKYLNAPVMKTRDGIIVPLVEVAKYLGAKVDSPWDKEEEEIEKLSPYQLKAKPYKRKLPAKKRKPKRKLVAFNFSPLLYKPDSIFGTQEDLDTKLLAGLGVIYHIRTNCDIEFRLGYWSHEDSYYDQEDADAWDYMKNHYGATCADYSSTYGKIEIWPIYLHIMYKIGAGARRDIYSHIKKIIPYIGMGWGYYIAEVDYKQLDVNGVNEFGFYIRNNFAAPHLIAGAEYYFRPNKSFKFELLHHLGRSNFVLTTSDLSGGSGISGITESDRQEIIDSYVNGFNRSNTRLDLRRLAYGFSFSYHF